ncbi:MAG: YihY/virulence factor BrkB family protein [Ilumatobacteraceae bacterium]|jgi:YihY family inner membrane protein
MSTATTVPETTHLTGHRAFDALRAAHVGVLLRDSWTRLRFADGLSHCRALAFQVVLTIIPGTIALVALASLLRWGSLSDAIVSATESLAPGPSADVFREAFGQGSQAGSSSSGWSALSVALPAFLVSGVTGFGQMERTANRIYGIEADRPSMQKYGRAAVAMLTTGTLLVLCFLVLGLGRDWLAGESPWGSVWSIARWPLGVALLTGAVAELFRTAPKRRQPSMSWLTIGGLISVVGVIIVSALLALYLTASKGFGDTYGPLAGFMGVALWAYLSSIAVCFGLAFAAQLESFRAGLPAPRDEAKARESDPDSVVIPYGTAALHPRR